MAAANAVYPDRDKVRRSAESLAFWLRVLSWLELLIMIAALGLVIIAFAGGRPGTVKLDLDFTLVPFVVFLLLRAAATVLDLLLLMEQNTRMPSHAPPQAKLLYPEFPRASGGEHPE